MPSNFVDLKQAAQMLGVTSDELVEMRSQGEIFGFRDGSSWKFKMDELERVAAERGTQLSGGGGGGGSDEPAGGDDSELDLSKPLFGSDSSELAPDDADGSSLGDLMASDDDLSLDSDDEADSLLVNDETPLVSDSGGGSTIIGASPSPESDLTLAADDDADVLGSDMTLAGSEVSGGSSILGGDLDAASKEAGGSDVRLVPAEGGSGVTIVPDSDELLVGPDGSGIGTNTGDSDDLEIGPDTGTGDLELSAGSGTGDLDLTADSSGGDLELSAGSGTGDLDLAADSSGGDLELSVGSGTGDLELDSGGLELDDGLEDDDDLVLGDSSAGSDVTLGTGDTGINLTSPSDSGLSLEEEPIELGAAASSLELPDEDMIALDDAADPDAATQLKQDEEFLLSPRDAIDDDDSGSQVIALEDSAAFDQDAATLLGNDAFGDAGGLEQQVQQQPMEMAPAGGGDLLAAAAPAEGAMAPMGAPGAELMGAAPVQQATPEAPYSIFNVLVLMLITGFLSLSGMLMMDVVRNMWSWEGADAGVSTSLMDGLLSALKMK